MKSLRITTVLAAVALLALAHEALAHPLPGEILKFQQLPLNSGLPPSTGGQPYPGHDEWSTAYPTPQIGNWQGTFMADDFADNYNTPVVHVRWWGSYQNNQTFNHVKNFLIAFESDLPFDPVLGGSRPDQVLSTQVVTNGVLSPGSGTFTETFLNTSITEDLYEYNAELALPFNQAADTVYWLKIVALVDPTVDGPINWGWHNRDWGIQNPLASPNVAPGEHVPGNVIDINGVSHPVWHFQDDAVAGRVDLNWNAAIPPVINSQNSTLSTMYQHIPGVVPIDGPPGIEFFSQDLAFELYTQVPEPGMLVLAGTGVVGLAWMAVRRRRRQPS
jgi:hypothetical protein